jgi:1-aminocyclopropane-1-carboxylate deaminase/D-cysteine desulfhydrase-like pyridoxal-dependent ACC family enzyme
VSLSPSSLDRLSATLLAHCQSDLLTPTRLQRLNGFAQAPAQIWVKREDESGFGISGCKKRKYASLLPYLREQGRPVLLIGGSHANHVVGLTQLLREVQLPFTLYLKKSHAPAWQGNGLLRQLLVDPAEIRWVATSDWPMVATLAQTECPDHLLIPEGGTHPAALPGACTLWLDLLRNEAEQGLAFDHIFIDSGTALMAGALLGMKQWHRPATALHVVLTAGDASFFQAQYARFQGWSREWVGEAFPVADQLHCYPPATARSFGHVNARILAEVRHLARAHGLLCDPVYVAKLFYTARQVIEHKQLTGSVLVIHSGGGSGLMGFGERFGQTLPIT